MNSHPHNDKAPGQGRQVGKAESNARHRTPPTVTGQCALVLNLIRRLQPVKSLDISVGHAVPELAARVHDLRCKGFDVRTEIVPAVEFRGEIRRKVAVYSLGVPEWPAPGFIGREDEASSQQHPFTLEG
jgi:hypothetical protein